MGKRAWSFRFPCRLACGHLTVFAGTAPWPGEHVWCTRCDSPGKVAAHYFEPSAPTGWCGLQAGDGRDELRCTLHRFHEGKHFDEFIVSGGAWFVPDGPLRSCAEGSCQSRS